MPYSVPWIDILLTNTPRLIFLIDNLHCPSHPVIGGARESILQHTSQQYRVFIKGITSSRGQMVI
jgi:hypothetical protein